MSAPKQVHNLNYQKPIRRALRNNSTQAEAILWRSLQSSQLAGRKFRRQHGIGPYVVDFYCPAKRLIIEIDGAGHFTASGESNDVMRTEYLAGLDYRVVRFENRAVMEQLDGVFVAIEATFLPEKAPNDYQPPPTPPQLRRGASF
ncbi:endonuclease domain-containing protein [Hymenobacter sp. HDW8]|uniref:endonuclease domain-containing protein n=1 Tax=Hymenobacter sp. HDW8 TaxID=2714932 RepID=UPI001407C080|nr:endonuclease domain-containing protein [Hymenobacter sp. HDW8]QIL77639.1 endonuclease domain-containing protein [Hymenobacter sp. HDW8]